MKYFSYLLIFVSLFCITPSVKAFEKEMIPDTEVKNDFVLGGGKIELEMDKGEKVTGEISITNRLGRTSDFNVEVEDFIGSNNPEDTSVIFKGDEKSPYSLKDAVTPEVKTFTLNHGERMKLPVTVFIPKDAEPGGRYGAVLVSVKNPEEMVSTEKDKATGKVQIISRLASLLFVTVKGETKKEGVLQDFKTDKSFYEKGPIVFKTLFKNTGNIHLKPVGRVEIENLMGKRVGEVAIEDYFVLPNALRERVVKWDQGFLFGRYKARVVLNRGYGDLVDQKEIYFWVIPWKIIVILFALCVFIVWFFQRLFSRFEIRRKK